MTVTRSASIASSVASGSNVAEGKMQAAPETAAVIVPITHPKQWNIGTGTHTRSFSVTRMYSAKKRALLTRFTCVSSTPLGQVEIERVEFTQDAMKQSNDAVGATYEALRALVQDQPVMHTDDTGWRVGGA